MDIEHIDYSKERILLVDDEEDFRNTIKGLLGKIGFQSNTVGSAVEALRELKTQETYTFLITDIVMPEMDGLELTRKVKKDYPDMCIIAITGFSSQYGYIDVINAGATDFINKPFRIDELEAKIRRGIIERNTHQELKRLCITDALTALYNQRHFYVRLNQEIMRTRRQKQRLALILFDLDDFKQYNDKNGHLAGDALLQKFAQIINSQIRQGVDSGYRYGGDEFAVILSHAGSDSCRITGQRISGTLKKTCGVGVSMGYAFFSEEMTAESFVEEADKNLYEFKGKKIE